MGCIQCENMNLQMDFFFSLSQKMPQWKWLQEYLAYFSSHSQRVLTWPWVAFDVSCTRWRQVANGDPKRVMVGVEFLRWHGTDLLIQTTSSYMVSCFHALSGFFAIYSTLNLNPKVNLTELLVRGEDYSRSWEDLRNFYKTQHYAEESCFRMPNLAYLLDDTLCLGDMEIMSGLGNVLMDIRCFFS
ncbi:uncharacterized protein [Aristolochia californica]|uniref:uncharacterized protein n=1 Tax=Aristolochia californica TaxID=171875 RepID=UPI0035E050DE